MSWNHRVIRTLNGIFEDEPYWYTVHEVYYKKKGGGEDYDNIVAWTNPISVCGATLGELRDTLAYISKAIEKPYLEIEKLEAQILK